MPEKKFEIVEKETLKSSEVVKQKIEELSDHMKKMVHEIQKTEAGKKDDRSRSRGS